MEKPGEALLRKGRRAGGREVRREGGREGGLVTNQWR